MKLALHVLADCVAVTLIALFALGLSSGQFLPGGSGTLVAEIWIYTLPIAAAGHWLLPRCYAAGVAGLRPLYQWLALTVELAVIACIGSFIGSAVVYGLNLEPGASFLQILSLATKLAIYLGVLVGIVHAMVILLSEQLSEAQVAVHLKEVETERARKLASEARLASLESHVHPHFLFNTLNTISSLINTSPARAERLIDRIANLLRFSLGNREAGLVPLEHELKVIQDYLEIEKERFGERLRFTIESEPRSLGIQVPPLAVQTLVENAVKHAVAPRRDGAEIRVRTAIADGGLRIAVSDTGPGFPAADSSPGHGLDNLRGRLTVLFGEAEPLEILRQDGWTTVRFRVPA
jgi:two-component system sensor histidine kinase AlgZ